MEFGVTSSLALDNWEQKYCQTLGNEPNQSHRVLRGRLFSKGKLKLFNSLFHSVYLVLFQKVCFLLPICSSCVICGSYATKRNVLLWQSARQTLASLGLLIWLVLLSIESKQANLSDAQIITLRVVPIFPQSRASERRAHVRQSEIWGWDYSES